MKRSTLLYIVVFVLVAGAAALLLVNRSNTTLPVNNSDFAIADTASITRIEMDDRKGHHSVLERKGPGRWIVNNKIEADQENVQILLDGLRLVQVKYPLSGAARETAIRQLATDGLKFKAYAGDKLVKAYTVGGPTPDHEGTYMYLEGASDPAVTQVPGFIGYLTPRYIPDEKRWRNHVIYRLNPALIEQVSIEYPNAPGESFILNLKGDDFTVEVPGGGRPTVKMDPLEGKQFLAGFRELNFEVFANLTSEQNDSVARLEPYAIVKVKASKGETPELRVIHKKPDAGTKKIENGLDADKFYGIMDNKPQDLVIVQRLVLEKIMAGYTALAVRNPGRK